MSLLIPRANLKKNYLNLLLEIKIIQHWHISINMVFCMSIYIFLSNN